MKDSPGLDLSAVGMLLLSGLGLLGALAMAGALALGGLAALITGDVFGGQALPFFSLAWTACFFALLLAPSLVNALIRLLNLQRPPLAFPERLRLASLLMVFFPALLLAGDLLARQKALSWLLLPLVQVLVTLIPVWWIFETGRRGLAMSGRQRAWGVISFNLVVGQPLILAVELLLVAGLIGLATLWLMGRPELVAEFQRLAQRLADSGMDPLLLERLFLPYLQRPPVLLGLLLIVAGLTPMLEELLKPLALWFLAWRGLTPVDGFVGGMLCGATFALMETLGNLSNPVDNWAVIVLGRLGTGLLHVVTSGLVGWGLASAVSEGRYLRFGTTYLLSVCLHSLWNVFSILMAVMVLFEPSGLDGFLALNYRLGNIAPLALFVLIVVMFLLLVGANRCLRSAIQPPMADGEIQALSPESIVERDAVEGAR